MPKGWTISLPKIRLTSRRTGNWKTETVMVKTGWFKKEPREIVLYETEVTWWQGVDGKAYTLEYLEKDVDNHVRTLEYKVAKPRDILILQINNAQSDKELLDILSR